MPTPLETIGLFIKEILGTKPTPELTKIDALDPKIFWKTRGNIETQDIISPKTMELLGGPPTARGGEIGYIDLEEDKVMEALGTPRYKPLGRYSDAIPVDKFIWGYFPNYDELYERYPDQVPPNEDLAKILQERAGQRFRMKF